MSLFKPSTWGISKVLDDIENYRSFIHAIKQESKNPKSKFNQWKLNKNYFYTIYFIMDLDETEHQLPENIKRLRMIESLAPLHRYLDEELGFAGSLSPEFNQFEDDKGQPTYSYLIAYRFVFEKLSLGWFLKWAVIIIALIIGYNKLDIIIPWLRNLIHMT